MSAEAWLFWGVVYPLDDLGDVEEFRTDAEGDLISLADWAYEVEQRLLREAVPEPVTNTDTYRGPEWDEWRERCRKWEQSGACEGRYLGYCDNSQAVAFFVVGSHVRVEWSQTATIAGLDVQPHWRDRLKEYVEAIGLPWKEPAWTLAAYYG